MLAVACGAYLTEAAGVGWALTLLVVALALLNLVLSFCAGCFVFYQLERWGVIRRSHT